jgi:hypothetical protein
MVGNVVRVIDITTTVQFLLLRSFYGMYNMHSQ